MALAPFLLDQWLEQFKGVPHDLAGSTGPSLRYSELLEALDASDRDRLGEMAVVYGRAGGSEELRKTIGRLYGAGPEAVVVTAGASEALHILFADAASSGGNVVVPSPTFPPILEMPRSLGLDVRSYRLRPERGFSFDVDEVAALIGPQTRLVLVNSPHNPTGATVAAEKLAELASICEARAVMLVADEVYWPLVYGVPAASAAACPSAVVVGSLSKAVSLSGLRIGWILERNAERRERYLNHKMYFTISNSPLAESIADAALRRHEILLARSRRTAEANLAQLSSFIDRNADLIAWVRPTGGTTAFPWLKRASTSRPFCEVLARAGVLLAPGDCFGMPQHVRVGFGSCPTFGEGLAIFERGLRQTA